MEARGPILHANWNVLQAKTGRWSCSGPNLQNVQRPEYDNKNVLIRVGMRDLFVSRPGMFLVEGDYKQLEVRIIAAIAGASRLVEAFNQGKDIYKFAAADLFGIDYAGVTKGQRQMGKIFILGSNYGGSASTLYSQLILWFPDITLKATELLQERWKNAHPEIPAYQRRMYDFAKEFNYVECPISGRRIPFYLDRIKPTEAANFPIQGSAGDIINPASLECASRLRPGMGEALLMQIHDALYLEGPDPARLAQIMRDTMVKTITFPNGVSMKFDIDLKVGTCWGDMKDYAG